LHLPGDETGDCHLFTKRLADRLNAEGVEFRFDTSVDALGIAGGALEGVLLRSGMLLSADACVIALATGASPLLRSIGIDIPIYPVKGYSITIGLADEAHAPRSSVMDEHSKVMVTRLGNRLRAAGIADIGAHSGAIEPKRADVVRDVTKAIFPLAGDYAHAQYWAGLRPMTPDGPPFLGRTPVNNLYVNLGHGSNGWTQSCGAARVVADVVSGRAPEIDMEGLTIEDRL
jgi:D-amino-acid dehydrogenase